MNMYRQGDVPIVSVARIPSSAIIVPRDNRGNVVLALGEVTGHAHRFESLTATMLRDADGSDYLRIADVALTLHPVRVEDEVTRDVALESGITCRLSCADFVLAQQAIAKADVLTLRGDILIHEEHHAIVIPPGLYALPGQYEYTNADMPEIRVAD